MNVIRRSVVVGMERAVLRDVPDRSTRADPARQAGTGGVADADDAGSRGGS